MKFKGQTRTLKVSNISTTEHFFQAIRETFPNYRFCPMYNKMQVGTDSASEKETFRLIGLVQDTTIVPVWHVIPWIHRKLDIFPQVTNFLTEGIAPPSLYPYLSPTSKFETAPNELPTYELCCFPILPDDFKEAFEIIDIKQILSDDGIPIDSYAPKFCKAFHDHGIVAINVGEKYTRVVHEMYSKCDKLFFSLSDAEKKTSSVRVHNLKYVGYSHSPQRRFFQVRIPGMENLTKFNDNHNKEWKDLCLQLYNTLDVLSKQFLKIIEKG